MAVPEFDLDALPEALGLKGEFGSELTVFLPFVAWLSAQGLLRNRDLVLYPGMDCFYRHLGARRIRRILTPRGWVRPQQRGMLPIRDEDTFDGTYAPSPMHVYPDFRALFGGAEIRCRIPGDKPLLIIHNKYNAEWWFRRAVNHITADVLETLFDALRAHHTVVYIRHGMGPLPEGYLDNVPQLPDLGDEAVLARFPEVLNFDDLYADHRARGGDPDGNLFKNALYARCHRFISSQGGGCHQIAHFAGALLLVLHRIGPEAEWPYVGYYRWMADPAPTLAVATRNTELLRGAALFDGATVEGGAARVAAGRLDLLAELAPGRPALRDLPHVHKRIVPPL